MNLWKRKSNAFFVKYDCYPSTKGQICKLTPYYYKKWLKKRRADICLSKNGKSIIIEMK